MPSSKPSGGAAPGGGTSPSGGEGENPSGVSPEKPAFTGAASKVQPAAGFLAGLVGLMAFL